ncbi:hypothetical protein PR048_002449 [Dryococelus australis]|uniref:RNA-directed DNA polymerase from mobile element jockey n=1 Tax=Dryococelus australis TaxID=614101 RepID=A0ABQ9IK72_9NEOP|nr:hypothetical protein PR048_002449 [Dryococelus australis]
MWQRICGIVEHDACVPCVARPPLIGLRHNRPDTFNLYLSLLVLCGASCETSSRRLTTFPHSNDLVCLPANRHPRKPNSSPISFILLFYLRFPPVTMINIPPHYTPPPPPLPRDKCLTTPGDVRHVIRKLKLCTAPGPDLIHSRIVFSFSRKAVVYLTHIVNAIFLTGYFPQTWKVATLVPLLKPRAPAQLPQVIAPSVSYPF